MVMVINYHNRLLCQVNEGTIYGTNASLFLKGVSEHKLYARIYPEACERNFEEIAERLGEG